MSTYHRLGSSTRSAADSENQLTPSLGSSEPGINSQNPARLPKRAEFVCQKVCRFFDQAEGGRAILVRTGQDNDRGSGLVISVRLRIAITDRDFAGRAGISYWGREPGDRPINGEGISHRNVKSWANFREVDTEGLVDREVAMRAETEIPASDFRLQRAIANQN